MEFLRTCVSDSEDDTMLKTTKILMKTKTTTDTMMPVICLLYTSDAADEL